MIKKNLKNNQTHYTIQLSVYDPNGKRYQPKFRTDREGNPIRSINLARLLEREYLLEFKAKLEKDYSKLSFEHFHRSFIESMSKTLKKGTVMLYDGCLTKWLDKEFMDRPLCSIKHEDIRDIVFEKLSKKGASANTQKKTLKALRRIFQSAIELGHIDKNPTIGLSVKVPPAVKMVLTPLESQKLLDCAREANHPFFYIWALALFTGMRSGELRALRWSDIDLETNRITVSRSWTNKDGLHSTKTNSIRIIPISSNLKELLLELKAHGPFSGALKGLNGKCDVVDDLALPVLTEWTHNEQARVLGEFCAQIGITKVKFHDLRSTFITNLFINGATIPVVMALAGHLKMSTTNIYLRLAGVDIKGATEILSYDAKDRRKENILSMADYRS